MGIPNSGLVLDLDWRTGLTTAAARLSQWGDLSTAGNHPTQATSSRRPLAEYGRPIVVDSQYDAEASRKLLTLPAGLTVNRRDCSIFVVASLAQVRVQDTGSSDGLPALL